MLLLILEDESMEPWTIVGSVIGAIIASIASWTGIWLNHRHQLKMQKEDHERQMKTKVYKDTINTTIRSGFLFILLPDLSPQGDDELFRQYMTPTEFYLWAENETLQAVYNFRIAMFKERTRLRNFDRSDEVEFGRQCHQSYFNLAIPEAKVIECIRREVNIPFNKQEYIKIKKTYFKQFSEDAGWQMPIEEEIDISPDLHSKE